MKIMQQRFFSEKVLLVEGDSDLIFIKAIAKRLNNNWDFDLQNIPIIPIKGKSNIKRFSDFFNSFCIKVYCLVDSDALIDGFEKFDVEETVKQSRAVVLGKLDAIAKQNIVTADLKADKIRTIVRSYSWKMRYQKLQECARKIFENIKLNEDELIELSLLFTEEENSVRRQVLVSQEGDMEELNELLHELHYRNIFILRKGAIENYYPALVNGIDKTTKALDAVAKLNEIMDCKDYLPKAVIKKEKEGSVKLGSDYNG
jgi:putative ATP-dependent endonuclease of OLD family